MLEFTPTNNPIGDRMAYTVAEALHVLNLGRTTLYAEIRAGRLRSFTVGNKRLFTPGALSDYVAAREAESGTDAA
jgi:excisionase family DNA binding protein